MRYADPSRATRLPSLLLMVVVGVTWACGRDGAAGTGPTPPRLEAAIASPLATPGGSAYGIWQAQATKTKIPKTPLAQVPAQGGTAEATADGADATFVTVGPMRSTATGYVDTLTSTSSATTAATVRNVNLRNLVMADSVVAVATSTGNGTVASSSAAGSAFFGLRVLGVAFGAELPAPNTRIVLPGGGFVILNEQIPSGDGVQISRLTVNMIHVVLNSAEIIVGSSSSEVSPFLPGPILGF